MIEHNEQRMKDVEIPLFELEQRVEKLEHDFSSYNIDMVSRISFEVAQRFNKKLANYLPQVHKLMEDFKQLKDKAELKWQNQDDTPRVAPMESVDQQQMVYSLNNLKTDMDYMKKMFSVQRI
jgi:hypothetical protein